MKKQYKAEMFDSRNTSIIIDILANNFKEAIKIAKNKNNPFPIIIDDNSNGWAEIENNEVTSATDEAYFSL